MMSKQTCDSCVYRHSNDGGGWCTRYPVWSAVKRDHFCGEYKVAVTQDVVPPAPKKPISPTSKPRSKPKSKTVVVQDL